MRGDWSATLDGKQYSGTVTGYVGPNPEDPAQAEVWGIFYDDIGPNDIEGRYNMLLDSESMDVVGPYTIEITWMDERQCYCELDVVNPEIQPTSYRIIEPVWWSTYGFTGTGTSTPGDYYDGPITVNDLHEDFINTTGPPWPFGPGDPCYHEGYAVLDYTCDLGPGHAKGYSKLIGPSFQKDLKFEGAIEASARGWEVMGTGPLTATMRHCAGDPCITEEEEVCFIATAAYGTSTAEEIDVLRAFRDGVLLQSSLGSQLVALYYEVSPPVAEFISENSLLRTIVRELVIDPMVSVATFTQAIWGK